MFWLRSPGWLPVRCLGDSRRLFCLPYVSRRFWSSEFLESIALAQSVASYVMELLPTRD